MREKQRAENAGLEGQTWALDILSSILQKGE